MDEIKITATQADDFTRALATQWGMGDVEAACLIRQGHSPSMASAMVGFGLFKLFGRKGAKDLPRKFVLAATPDRVVAFDCNSHSEGEGTDATLHVTIHPGEVGEWPRGSVSMRPDDGGINPNATLVLAGTEVPCTVPDSDAKEAFARLVTVLSG